MLLAVANSPIPLSVPFPLFHFSPWHFHAQPAMQFHADGCCCHAHLAHSLATKLADICHEVSCAIFSLFLIF